MGGANGTAGLASAMTEDAESLAAQLAQARRELARRDLLLRVAAHRARSASGSIIALLGLQIREMRDPAVKAALEMTRSRMQAMGRVHQILEEEIDGKSVDLGRVIRGIVQALAEALDAQDRRINVTVSHDAPPILAEAAVPLALVANELVGNALRYAFKGRDRGRVWVQLKVDGGRLTLSVRDDGIGISDKTLAAGSSGLFLVRALASDLGARLDFVRAEGTLVTLAMPSALAV